MPVISLIAPAGQLDPALVSSLQGAFGATGDAVWLSPDEACEFPVSVMPGNLKKVRASLAASQVDLNVVTEENRRKTLLIADMDSTMIEQECIDELAVEAGVGDQVADITARAMNGELDFEAAIIERVGLLRGLPTEIIDHVLQTRITHAPGGRTLVRTMKARGARAALVSGGFVQFTSKVGAALGFDETRANRLIEADGKLTGDVARPILGRDAKVEALRDLVEDPADAIAVGDGANDLGMIEAAGMGVALHAKPVVAEQAPLRIDHCDLTALLFLQGYHKDDFVTD
ncbi:MAG: phosphoserine phosphatase SerB [Pseudomonadota bacterium]